MSALRFMRIVRNDKDTISLNADKKTNTRTSPEQYKIYLDFLENNPLFRTNKSVSPRYYTERWNELIAALNGCESGAKRELGVWKAALRNWKCEVRRKGKEIYCTKNEDGGVQHFKNTLNQFEQRYLDVTSQPFTPSKEDLYGTVSADNTMVECEPPTQVEINITDWDPTELMIAKNGNCKINNVWIQSSMEGDITIEDALVTDNGLVNDTFIGESHIENVNDKMDYVSDIPIDMPLLSTPEPTDVPDQVEHPQVTLETMQELEAPEQTHTLREPEKIEIQSVDTLLETNSFTSEKKNNNASCTAVSSLVSKINQQIAAHLLEAEAINHLRKTKTKLADIYCERFSESFRYASLIHSHGSSGEDDNEEEVLEENKKLELKKSIMAQTPTVSEKPVLAVEISPSVTKTVVIYKFCEEEFPYRTKIPGSNITLKQFKEYLPKKGTYRYFCKTLCADLNYQVIQEEIMCDEEILPLWEGKIMATIKSSD